MHRDKNRSIIICVSSDTSAPDYTGKYKRIGKRTMLKILFFVYAMTINIKARFVYIYVSCI